MLDNLSLVDLKALSELLVKLIDTIGRGLGMTFQSLSIYLNGKAEANRYLTMEKAKTDAQVYHRETMAKSNDVLQDRIMAREAKRQNNIKDVTEVAANELNGLNNVSDKPVSEVWITRFFNTVEDVSDDELKIIWGKILAGEVKSPGSYSLRTLETLKNLSKGEAILFTKACNMAVGYGQYSIIGNRHETNTGLGLSFDEANLLMEAGLLNSTFDAMNEISCEEGAFILVYQDYVLKITYPSHQKATTGALIFTNAANELYNIVGKFFDMPYIKRVSEYFKKRGATKFEYGKYREIKEDSEVNFDNEGLLEIE